MKLHKRYYYLPEKHWAEHRMCELLINQIEEYITNEIFNDLRFQEVQIDPKNPILKDEHIFDYLLRIDKKDEHNLFIKKNITNALIMDTCYFLQEALVCSKKKRLTVSFALLRKPFVYDLIIFLRILFETDFIEKYNTQESFDATKLTDEDKLALLNLSTTCLFSLKTIKGSELFDWIFNQSNPDSIINISNKALHPSTNRNKNNMTEMQNLNFVFANNDNIENLWSFFYNRIPLLLLYFLEIIDALIMNLIEIPEPKFQQRLEERIKILTM